MSDFLGMRGKVALVVGGGLGMGEATALRFAGAGCDVAVLDLDRERAERVAESIRALGRKAVALSADVLDEATAKPTIDEARAALGPIDVMATIVGQASWSKFLNVTPDLWDRDHRLNLRYFFFYAQAVAASMIENGRRGAITAVASVSGVQSAPNHSAYGAAKAGLIGLIRSMAVELAEHGIRANAVAPGTIRTPRIEAGRDTAAWDAKIRDSLIPAKRLGTVDEIADAILFLSSQMATYITGQTLAVDGGLTAQFLLGAPRDA
jgi:NAD(P)-dependent dehydrogenase (short-subunit alcohol dehydrogenase family)